MGPLNEAADLAPDSPAPLQLLCKVFEAKKDWEEVVRIKNRRLDVVSGDETPFDDEIARTLTLDKLDAAIDRLPELERDVVRLRFGLDGSSPASLESTARTLGIGVRRVRRIEASALAFLAVQPEVEGVHDAA